MRYIARISVLLSLVLVFGNPLNAKSQVFDLPNNNPLAQNRIVVFEAFMRST